MLTSSALLDADGLRVADVVCTCGRSPISAPEPSRGWALVLVRRGVFRRNADGDERLLEAGAAYVSRPGEEERFAHPADGGDACTAVVLSEDLRAALLNGEPDLPLAASVEVGRELDLRHRLLVAALRRGEDGGEQALELAAGILERLSPGRTALSATERRRRALADDAREALAVDPSLSLPALGRQIGAAPHHLSRVFKVHNGHTITEHRRRQRVRAALERLAAGDADLARVAADAGFADQSHLTRTIRAQTGTTPSALRAALRPA
jgi:AraC-like DNA-binding protein